MPISSATPCLSFIGIVDFSQEARWLYMTGSVTELLGFEPKELIGRSSLELVHPDEFPRVKKLHYDTIQLDKAAVLVYLRLRHKDPYKGYILCGIVSLFLFSLIFIDPPRSHGSHTYPAGTVVHNVLVGSVSFASPGAKALHNASTAQEIEVITPSAMNFEFRVRVPLSPLFLILTSLLFFKRWHDPSPMPPSPTLASRSLPTSGSSPTPSSSSSSSSGTSKSSWRASPGEAPSSPRTSTIRTPTPSPPPPPRIISFPHLPNKSFRTAFILDRFTVNCTILYCSNDLFLSTTSAIGRSFFDFVARRDDEIVRSWVGCVKGWGVNERGQPSDGGFGFGRFTLLTEGRDSISRLPEPAPSRRERQGSTTSRGSRPSTSSTASSSSSLSSRYRDGRTAPTPLGRRPQNHPTSLLTQNQNAIDPAEEDQEQFAVDAIFSAHSDGLMVILRRGSSSI
ncbi:hypothetical protein K443DRAFT_10330 [Laccaria amethystina LaAM-08-1]|uniref:PAS domain-containing protein n=1 Tax=Laccaria amethystina LaAM-08-1 TaxID=1095629 RepID=A0A0C9X689_9AGAR|nr:hypothetical protein K443DRAFT_10330 [Laccaria amethystina LaAM-08-1]